MHTRLKAARKSLKMTQVNFAKEFGMSQSGYAAIEIGDRPLNDRIIKAVCTTFNINEGWLRDGKGSMFIKDDKNLMNELSLKFKLTPEQLSIIETFISLPAADRDMIVTVIESAAANVQASRKEQDDYDAETDRLLEQLRREREAEKRGAQESLQEQSEKRA